MTCVSPGTGTGSKFGGDGTQQDGITYIAADEGWLFLAVVIDLFSRQVIGGWSLRQDMTREIVIDALRMAGFRRYPGSTPARAVALC